MGHILPGGIGLGYKYYTAGNSKNLMYISAGMAKYYFGEFSPDVSGFSIATGVSKYKGEKTTVVKKPRFVFASNGVSKYKSFLNIGISIYCISSKRYSRERENEFGIAPFINLETRKKVLT